MSLKTRASKVKRNLEHAEAREIGPWHLSKRGPLEESEVDDIQNAIDKGLVRIARRAKENAFAPHSDYPVGASLLTDKGVFVGANVEVSAIQPIHAEQLAISNAVTEGQAEKFYTMAVSAGRGPHGKEGPCGLCQHTISQFTDELRILEDRGEDKHPSEFSLSELIGDAYSASSRYFDEVVDSK